MILKIVSTNKAEFMPYFNNKTWALEHVFFNDYQVEADSLQSIICRVTNQCFVFL